LGSRAHVEGHREELDGIRSPCNTHAGTRAPLGFKLYRREDLSQPAAKLLAVLSGRGAERLFLDADFEPDEESFMVVGVPVYPLAVTGDYHVRHRLTLAAQKPMYFGFKAIRASWMGSLASLHLFIPPRYSPPERSASLAVIAPRNFHASAFATIRSSIGSTKSIAACSACRRPYWPSPPIDLPMPSKAPAAGYTRPSGMNLLENTGPESLYELHDADKKPVGRRRRKLHRYRAAAQACARTRAGVSLSCKCSRNDLSTRPRKRCLSCTTPTRR
jgi:hypothetical protein